MFVEHCDLLLGVKPDTWLFIRFWVKWGICFVKLGVNSKLFAAAETFLSSSIVCTGRKMTFHSFLRGALLEPQNCLLPLVRLGPSQLWIFPFTLEVNVLLIKKGLLLAGFFILSELFLSPYEVFLGEIEEAHCIRRFSRLYKEVKSFDFFSPEVCANIVIEESQNCDYNMSSITQTGKYLWK